MDQYREKRGQEKVINLPVAPQHKSVSGAFSVFVAASLLSGCSASQNALNGYAGIAFVVYLLSVAGTTAIHHLHDRPGFQAWKARVRKWSVPAGVLMVFAGIITTLVHAWMRLREERMGSVPWIFLGAVAAIGGQALIMWSRQTCPEKQKCLLKVVSLSMAFCLALLYLATGGKLLKG